MFFLQVHDRQNSYSDTTSKWMVAVVIIKYSYYWKGTQIETAECLTTDISIKRHQNVEKG